ncbi:MAG: PrsW family intramembrane metalloprotease [Ktedonobacterales bacterium]|nr:PrsW family intramembrane metalloprotease [Ktedonobacterales bacterium]
MRCPHCGREAPAGEFCAHCGAHLPVGDRLLDARRTRTYAADPREHLLHLSVITTLFPHLNPHRTFQARWLLLAGAVLVFLVGLGRFVPLSIVLAALLVPVLYLLYFFLAGIHEDEPLPVLAATFLAGAVFGTLLSVAFYRVILGQRRLIFGPAPSYVLLTGILLPLLAQALMLIGPLVLYFTRRRFNDLLDGLAFGAASGLGFAAAQSVVYSWLLIAGPFQRGGSATSWALPTIRIALLVPLLDAATTGLICAALWLRRDHHAPRRRLGWLAFPPVAALVGTLGQVVPSLGFDLVGGQITALVWYGVTAGVMLLLVRVVLHAGLLEKAQELGHGGVLTCPGCHHSVPDVAFCPGCGLALRSIAKHARHPSGQEERHA